MKENVRELLDEASKVTSDCGRLLHSKKNRDEEEFDCIISSLTDVVETLKIAKALEFKY